MISLVSAVVSAGTYRIQDEVTHRKLEKVVIPRLHVDEMSLGDYVARLDGQTSEIVMQWEGAKQVVFRFEPEALNALKVTRALDDVSVLQCLEDLASDHPVKIIVSRDRVVIHLESE